MKRPNKKDNKYGHGDHALMWYSDAQDKYIDYLESKLKSDLLHSVSYAVSQQYAEFCVRCDRDNLPLIKIEDYLKQL